MGLQAAQVALAVTLALACLAGGLPVAQACECGSRKDASGKVVQCGTCPVGKKCQANKCVQCTPLTRCWAKNECGTQGNGCGGRLQCGTCTAGNVCKAGKCVPKDSSNVNCQCGNTTDATGAVVSCGTCASGLRCQNNTCVTCTPLTQCWASFECGLQGNRCGGSINCGTCPTGKTCDRYKCVDSCKPLTECYAENECGTQGNGCGSTINCGTCPSGTTCQANKCVPSCTPRTQCSSNQTCGTQPNGCGGTINCGTCADGYACTGGRCCWDTCSTCGRNSDQCGGSFDCACPKGAQGQEFVCTEDAFGQMDGITCIRTEACLCFNQPGGAPECTDKTTQADSTAIALQSCVDKVAALRPSCKSTSWTLECRRLATIVCAPSVRCPVIRTQTANNCLCNELEIPTAGNLGSLYACLSNTLNERCVQAVCKKDPVCCDSYWDQTCIDLAVEDGECPAVCG